MKIEKIVIYPIKSCGKIELDSCILTKRGLELDRLLCLVSNKSGKIITQREKKVLSTIKVNIKENCIVVRKEGFGEKLIDLKKLLEEGIITSKGSLNIFIKDTCYFLKYSSLDGISKWFSTIIGEDCSLVLYNKERNRESKRYRLQGKMTNPFFHDMYPLSILSQESLDNLNTRLLSIGQEAISYTRFRPNILISGCSPHQEDEGDIYLKEGVKLEFLEKISRCIVTCIDNGEVLKQPMSELSTYRFLTKSHKPGKDIYFGSSFAFNYNYEFNLKVGDVINISNSHLEYLV